MSTAPGLTWSAVRLSLGHVAQRCLIAVALSTAHIARRARKARKGFYRRVVLDLGRNYNAIVIEPPPRAVSSPHCMSSSLPALGCHERWC